jgi:hypothetical protein
MKTSYKITLSLVLIIFIAGTSYAVYLFNKRHKDLEKTRSDFALTATDLLKEFENDENKASAKYVNKVLEVSGVIESLNAGDDKTVSIALKTESDFSTVICTFQQLINPADYRQGENITVKGECSGFLTDVLLNKCYIKK